MRQKVSDVLIHATSVIYIRLIWSSLNHSISKCTWYVHNGRVLYEKKTSHEKNNPPSEKRHQRVVVREWSSESGHQRVVMCVMFDSSPWIILTVISQGNKWSPHSLILIISHQQPQQTSKTSKTSRTSRTRRTRRTSRTMNNLLLLIILTVAAYQSEAERKINSFIVL